MARLVLLMPNGDDPEKSQLTLLSPLQAARMAESHGALRYCPRSFPAVLGCYLPNAASVWLESAHGATGLGAPGSGHRLLGDPARAAA
jgi:hypothetical protein